MFAGRNEMGRSGRFAAALAIATAWCAPGLVQAEQMSPNGDEPAGHNISAYDYQITSDGKLIRLKMESVKGERVYSSFIDGAVIASVRIPDAPSQMSD